MTTPTLHRPVLGGTRGTTRPGNAPLRGAEEADSSADPVAVPGAGHVGVLDVSSAPPPERRRAGCRRGRAATPGEGGADPQAAGHLHPQSAAPCWDGGLELSPCPRRQSTHPAGSTSTLAGPNFGPKNGVHLTSPSPSSPSPSSPSPSSPSPSSVLSSSVSSLPSSAASFLSPSSRLHPRLQS